MQVEAGGGATCYRGPECGGEVGGAGGAIGGHHLGVGGAGGGGGARDERQPCRSIL